jgi:hypothetical protein
MRGIQNVNINKIGVIVHELIHLFGVPDLYDTDGPLNQVGTIGGLGNYDIMVSVGLLAISLGIVFVSSTTFCECLFLGQSIWPG